MIEPRQDVALGRKTAQHFFRVGPALQDLDRDFFFKLPVRPLRQIDRAHSAAAQLARHHVGADPPAGARAFFLPKRDRRLFRQSSKESVGSLQKSLRFPNE